MSKRARYDGPHEEVNVFDSEAGIYAGPIDTVKRGGLLSADAPARIRDELGNSADWTLVDHASGPAKTTDKKGDD
jgi:hypothetical protein